MKAAVLRDKETGEFACILDGLVLAKGKSGPMVSRAYDMAEAVNAAIDTGNVPQVTTEGRGAERRFGVVWGLAVIADGMSATGAYRILDSLEALFEPTVTVTTETPTVPMPDGVPMGAQDDGITHLGFSDGQQ